MHKNPKYYAQTIVYWDQQENNKLRVINWLFISVRIKNVVLWIILFLFIFLNCHPYTNAGFNIGSPSSTLALNIKPLLAQRLVLYPLASC